MSKNHHDPTFKLALGALGVVFGDIGTSPLYAVQECFAHGLTPEPANVMGVVSLIFWSLTIVVSIKYALLIMRADNNGEGGVFSLLALVLRAARRDSEKNHDQTQPAGEEKLNRLIHHILLAGMFGAALFFGDSLVTPAISVLSAVEGLDVVTPKLHDFVMPIAIVILVSLFCLQRFGSQKIGNSFGPIMAGWFCCLGLLGIKAIGSYPGILYALNPIYAFKLIAGHGWMSFSILGASLLAFTGGEALYADMGHFGLKSIRIAWYGLVMPALIINYFGQGALIISHADYSDNPFYHLVPQVFLLPMILLASVATVIASQAVISGTFSLVRQAIRMEFLPRFTVIFTSALEQGQIYLPKVNMILCLGVVMLVLIFRSSSALAGAYGFAVGGAMLVDTLLVSYVARHVWRWTALTVILIFGPIFVFDFTYFTTAAAKIPDGGWLPLSIGIAIITVFLTWRHGRNIVRQYHLGRHEKLDSFVARLPEEQTQRSQGTSVYLTPVKSDVPDALISAYARYQVLRKSIVVLEIVHEDAPIVESQHKTQIHYHGKGIWQVSLHYGFSEHPHITDDLRGHMARFLEVDMNNITYFVGRAIFVEGQRVFYPKWTKKLFLWLANNIEEEFNYSRMPTEQLVQIGTQIEV